MWCKHQAGVFLRRLTGRTVIILSEKLSKYQQVMKSYFEKRLSVKGVACSGYEKNNFPECVLSLNIIFELFPFVEMRKKGNKTVGRTMT